MSSEESERNNQVADKRRAGQTLAEIGREYGLTRERVRQICQRMQAFPSAATRQTKAAKKIADMEDRCWERWGCSLGFYSRLRSMHPDWEKCPIGRYVCHRNNARRRGIEWNLTLSEWWEIWEASGHWDNRGNRKGQYVMCRRGDRGPYKAGNVRIATTFDNSQEYNWDSKRFTKPKARAKWGEVIPTYDGLTNREVFGSPYCDE